MLECWIKVSLLKTRMLKIQTALKDSTGPSFCWNLRLCKCTTDVLQTLLLTYMALNPPAHKELAQESHLQTHSVAKGSKLPRRSRTPLHHPFMERDVCEATTLILCCCHLKIETYGFLDICRVLLKSFMCITVRRMTPTWVLEHFCEPGQLQQSANSVAETFKALLTLTCKARSHNT